MFKIYSVFFLINLGVSSINCGTVVEDAADHVKVDPALLEDGNKAFAFDLPSFLAMANANKPPTAQGTNHNVGQVTGLYSTNNNTLIAESGPNSNAIASLTSTSYYGGGPTNSTLNNTSQDEHGATTDLQNMGGMFMEAYESTHAWAQGDNITFINSGSSHASGDGASGGAGSSTNNGGTGGGWGGWGGWKNEPSAQAPPSQPNDDPAPATPTH